MELFDKELALIQGYVEVTQIRYPDGLSIIYDIDPEIRLVRVPPLLIHNFIENVVKHALSCRQMYTYRALQLIMKMGG